MREVANRLKTFLFLAFLLMQLDAPARALWLEIRLALPPSWLVPAAVVLGCVCSVTVLTVALVLLRRHRPAAAEPMAMQPDAFMHVVTTGSTGGSVLRQTALVAVGIAALRLLTGTIGMVEPDVAGTTLILPWVAVPAQTLRIGLLLVAALVPLVTVLRHLLPRAVNERRLPRIVRLLALPAAAVLLSLPNRAIREVLLETDIGAFTGLMLLAAIQAFLLAAVASRLPGRASQKAEAQPRPHADDMHPSLLIPLTVVLFAMLLWLSFPQVQTPVTLLAARSRAAVADAARMTEQNRPYAAWTHALRAQADADLLAAYTLFADLAFVHEGRPDPDGPRIYHEVIPAISAALALEPANDIGPVLEAVSRLYLSPPDQGIEQLKALYSATATSPVAKRMAAASLLPVTGDPGIARYLALHDMTPYQGMHEPLSARTIESANRRLSENAKAAVLTAGPAHLESLWLFKRFDTALADAGTVLRYDPGNPAANRYTVLADLDRNGGSANYEVAMAALDRLVAAHDGNDEVIRFVLETTMRVGNAGVAMRIAEPWYQRHTDSAMAAGCYAWALMARAGGQPFGDDDRVAQKLLSEALAAGGDPCFLRIRMAESRLKEGAFGEAISEIVLWNEAERAATGEEAEAAEDTADTAENQTGALPESDPTAPGESVPTQPEPVLAVDARDQLYLLAYAYSRHIGEAAADEALLSCMDTWPAFANLVVGIRAQGDRSPEKARRHLEAAWAGGITIPRCSLVLGVALYECALTSGSQAQMDRAERMLRLSTVEDPENATAWYSLGALLERRQAYDESYAAYARASLLVPDDSHRQDVIGIGPHARIQMGAVAGLRSEVK